jgi:hypothetical protein
MKPKQTISNLFRPGSVFVLAPGHPGDRFIRRIVIEGRQPRMVRFTPGVEIHLDDAEQTALAVEIAGGYIGRADKEFPPPKPKPRPKLDPSERDERDPITLEFFDPIERHRRRCWW